LNHVYRPFNNTNNSTVKKAIGQAVFAAIKNFKQKNKNPLLGSNGFYT